MSLKVLLHPKAAKVLKKLGAPTRRELKRKLAELGSRPTAGKPLRYSDFRSLRAGKYRAIYEIQRAQGRVVVLFIGHRDHVYEDFSKLL